MRPETNFTAEVSVQGLAPSKDSVTIFALSSGFDSFRGAFHPDADQYVSNKMLLARRSITRCIP